MPDGIVLRFIMVLGGMAPLFILWAVRGAEVMCNWIFRPGCLAIALIPNAVLLFRLFNVRKRNYGSVLEVGALEDRRDGILTYIVAILLPFYSSSLETWPEFFASLGAVVFILVVFMYLDLHYVNVFFAVCGFRIYFVKPMEPASGLSSRQGAILITRLPGLRTEDRFSVAEIAKNIYAEREKRIDPERAIEHRRR